MQAKLQFFTYGVIATSLVAFSFLTATNLYAQWNEPSSNPPGGNVSPPINVGQFNQHKAGGFGANVLAAYEKFNFVFKNTSASLAWPAWRLVRNDGTGDFLTYINSEGGTNPTFESPGHAFKEKYNPGDGIYQFSTSNGSGSTGSAITWNPAMSINPDGSVNITKLHTNQFCDENGNNCTGPGGGDGGDGGDGGGFGLGSTISGVPDHPTQSAVDSYCGSVYTQTGNLKASQFVGPSLGIVQGGHSVVARYERPYETTDGCGNTGMAVCVIEYYGSGYSGYNQTIEPGIDTGYCGEH